MRLHILSAIVLASASLGLAAPPKPGHDNDLACPAPSQPDRKVPAYGPPSKPSGPPAPPGPPGPPAPGPPPPPPPGPKGPLTPRQEKRQLTCPPSSQPDRKVPAYSAKQPKTPKAPKEPKEPKVKEPKAPKDPKAPRAPKTARNERREAAFVMPELHRKITVQEEVDGVVL